MTSEELTREYVADVRQLHNLFDNGLIDRIDFDSRIEALDNRFFTDLDMVVVIPTASQLERILAYS